MIEIAGEICSSMISTNTEDRFHGIHCDLDEAVSSLDGSNACQCFSASFADLLLREKLSVLQTEVGRQKLRQTVESMLTSIPSEISSVQDVGQQVT